MNSVFALQVICRRQAVGNQATAFRPFAELSLLPLDARKAFWSDFIMRWRWAATSSGVCCGWFKRPLSVGHCT